MLLCLTSTSFVLAQDFQPPQIPNYNLPPDEQNNLDINIPSEPSNPGVPKTEPTIAPTPTPESQPDYGLIFFAITIAAAIAGIIVIWTAWARSKKRKTLSPQPT